MECERRIITAIHTDGGYQEYLTARAQALAPIPEGISFAEAAPLLCAGVTAYNSCLSKLAFSADFNLDSRAYNSLGNSPAHARATWSRSRDWADSAI